MNTVPYILETNLAISRFMCDHALILLTILPNKESIIYYEKELKMYETFLLDLISYSYNRISKEFIDSEILITDYTVFMLNKTCELYKIDENKEIDLSCKNLILYSKLPPKNFTNEEYKDVHNYNTLLLRYLKISLDNLHKIKNNLNLGLETILFANDFIEHLIDEVEIFMYTLDFFERKLSFTPTYVYTCNYYFNLFLETHSIYIKQMTFPVNYKYYTDINLTEKGFNKISNNFKDDVSPRNIRILNRATKKVNVKFSNYNSEVMHSIMNNKNFLAVIPLLSDHILRESNYVNYQLDVFHELA